MSDSTKKHPALVIDTERLARLQKWAAIAPHSQDEDGYLRHELNSQLDEMVVKVLDGALDSDLAAVDPATYGVDLPPHCGSMRDDIVEPWPDVDALLDSAPHTRHRYFVVPPSKHEEL